MCAVLHLSVTWLPWAWQTNREMVRAKAQERDRGPSSSLLRLEGCLSALPLACLAQCVWFSYCHYCAAPQHLQLKRTPFCPLQPQCQNKLISKQTMLQLHKSGETIICRSQRGVICFVKWILFSPWLQSRRSQELRLTKAPTRELERKMDEVAPRHSYQVSMCFIP